MAHILGRINTSKKLARSFHKLAAEIPEPLPNDSLSDPAINRCKPTPEQLQAIAECCLEWAVNPGTKVAVQIGAIEVLLILKGQIEWIALMLDDLLEVVARNPSPAMTCRLNRWKKS